MQSLKFPYSSSYSLPNKLRPKLFNGERGRLTLAYYVFCLTGRADVYKRGRGAYAGEVVCSVVAAVTDFLVHEFSYKLLRVVLFVNKIVRFSNSIFMFKN